MPKPKQVRYIEVTKDGVTTKYLDDITAICRDLEIPYGTIIKKKMPFEYKGIKFERITIK